MQNIKGALGIAWSFPPKFSLQEGVVVAEDYERIKQSLIVVLSTLPAERIMRPEFGCDLHQFMFMNINEALLAQISSVIKDNIQRNEPRVELLSVDVEKNRLKPYCLQVLISYRVYNSDQKNQLSGELDLVNDLRWGDLWQP